MYLSGSLRACHAYAMVMLLQQTVSYFTQCNTLLVSGSVAQEQEHTLHVQL
jgi:predicted Rdx family selenoprotein